MTHEYLPTRGGAATVVDELARAAHAEGWPAKVLAPGKATAPDESGIPVVRMGHRGKQDFLARRALLGFLKRYDRKPDEHLVFSDPGATRAALYAPVDLLNHPGGYSVILHGSEIPLFSTAPTSLRFRELLLGAYRIHLLSEANRNLLARFIPEIRDSVRVAPGAPSTWILRGTRTVPPPQESQLLTILTVGRIHPRKGQKETLLALSHLPDALRQKIRYRIVGPTIRRSYLREIRNLARRCRFPVDISGILSDEQLFDAYASADLFALNSQSMDKSIEGFGLVYLDASAFGLPIVANRIGGVSEAVLHGKTGLLADPNDPRSLTDLFRRLLEDGDLREALGREARNRAIRRDWSQTLREVWGSP